MPKLARLSARSCMAVFTVLLCAFLALAPIHAAQASTRGSFLDGVLDIVDMLLGDDEDDSAAMTYGSATTVQSSSDQTVTVMIYMNGSNLESEDNAATEDLIEMVNAGSSDKVNVVVETLGTSSWNKTFGIASNRSQIYTVSGDGLTLVRDNMGQLDSTVSSTLQDFVTWTAANYPADRYMLIFWDHGAGPVWGFGYDEFQDEDDALTIDEMQQALRNAGVHFDFIGMDACIMASLEVCCALYDSCDYTILSEDFESGIGWYYTPWLQALYADTSISTPELGKTIVDSMIRQNETSRYGDDGILAVIDESAVSLLYAAWVNFAYENTDALLSQNYSMEVQSHGRVHPRFDSFGGGGWGYTEEDASMDDYYVTDIMAVASSVDSDSSAALESAISQAIVYMKATSGDAEMTGLSVTLPYGDSSFYQDLQKVFSNCGFDQEYIDWLGNFVNAAGVSEFYDWGSWDDQWSGWSSYEDDYSWGDWGFSAGGYDDFFGWAEDSDDWDDWSFWGDDDDDWWGSDYGDSWWDSDYSDSWWDSDDSDGWSFWGDDDDDWWGSDDGDGWGSDHGGSSWGSGHGGGGGWGWF